MWPLKEYAWVLQEFRWRPGLLTDFGLYQNAAGYVLRARLANAYRKSLIENRGEAIAVRWFSSPLNSFQQPRRGQTKRRSPSEQHQERNIISRFADI